MGGFVKLSWKALWSRTMSDRLTENGNNPTGLVKKWEIDNEEITKYFFFGQVEGWDYSRSLILHVKVSFHTRCKNKSCLRRDILLTTCPQEHMKIRPCQQHNPNEFTRINQSCKMITRPHSISAILLKIIISLTLDIFLRLIVRYIAVSFTHISLVNTKSISWKYSSSVEYRTKSQ